MTAASEKISEQALRDCIVTHPRSSFERIHNAAIDELLSLRAEHEELRESLKDARHRVRWMLQYIKDIDIAAIEAELTTWDAAQGAARGTG